MTALLSALCVLWDSSSDFFLNKLIQDTLMNCEGGNPVSAPGVGGNVPLVAVDLGR